MEDLRKRCEFNNTTIKVQACHKLLELVRGHLNTDEPFTQKTIQTPELKLLWEKCSDTDTAVSRTCCHGLFSLVENGVADFDHVIKCFLNLVPTAKSLTGICGAVCDLLVLHQVTMVQSTGQYKCPYAIRNPPHPLVTMVTNRPDAWNLVLQNVERLFTMSDERVSASLVEMLSPLIRFILLEPPQSPQFLPLRLSLVPALLRATSGRAQAYRDQLRWEIVRILTRCQLKTFQNISEVLQHVACLIHSYTVVKETTSDLQKKTTQSLVALAADVCRIAVCLGFDTSQLLSSVLTMAKDIPESIDSDEFFLNLLELLEKLSIVDVKPALALLYLWLRRNQERNYLLSHMAILPVLQLVAMPTVAKEMTASQQKQAIRILSLLQEDVHAKDIDDAGPIQLQKLSVHLTPESSFLAAYAHITKSFGGSEQVARHWLDNIHSTLSNQQQVPYHYVCLVAAVFITSDDGDVIHKSLCALAKCAERDSSKSPCMLPLLLYKTNKLKDPDLKLAILRAIPKMVTHKVAIAPVLRTLQILSGQPKLKAVSIALISSLWEQQDRCFPYLQQLIVDTGTSLLSSGGLHTDECMLARASAIRDVCKMKPHQHGTDVLAPLSDILNQCLANNEATTVSLALQGLYYLCETEVLDILTAWSVLADKMAGEERPLVIASVCRLLSLVPELETDGKEYLVFTQDVLELLWQYTQSQDATVAGAAFRALSKFSRMQFHIGHLPSELTSEVRQAALNAAEREGTDLSQVAAPDIPGSCFVDLFKLLPTGVIEDYEVFLMALARDEVSKIPRGVHHAANRKKASSANQNKAVAAIPAFLQTEFERNKVPGLRPSLAFGVLQSYDPAVSTGRDGKPRPHQVVQLGRNYHQMLYSLIHECPIQVGEWHQNVALPQAWLGFMDRCFQAYSEGRRVEIGQQLDRGLAHDPEENRQQQDLAFLWARDKITDLICSTSSGNPSVQGNGLLALGGLVVAVTKFYNALDEEAREKADGATDHLSYPHWLMVVTETLLCVLDHKVLTDSRLLNVGNLRTGSDRSPCSVLAQCGAALSLSMIVAMVITTNTDAVYQLLTSLAARLPGAKPSDDPQPVLHFFIPQALGLVLARLFEEHFVETGGNQAMIAVWKALDSLEKICLSNESNRLGAYLGLSVCLVSMCTDNKTDTRVHVCTMHDKLVQVVDTTSVTDAAYEGACLCLAAVAGATYTANFLTQEVIDQDVAKLYTAHCEHPQMPGVTLALGLACQLLAVANHPTVGDLILKLYGSWITGLGQQDLPTLQRISFLKGVLALSGCEKLTFNIAEDTGANKTSVNAGEVAKVTQQLVRDRHDLGLQCACAWQLGQLSMSAASTGQSRLCVPMTYHYLPDTSIIRAMIDTLLKAGKHGDAQVPEQHLVPILRVLTRGPSQPLPPLNWAGVLSPVIRMVYGADVERWSLELAATQSAVSSSAGLLLSSWLLSPLWGTLKLDSQLGLLQNLPKFLRSVPLTKLKEFFETGFLQPFMKSVSGSDTDASHVGCRTALEGLLGALRIPDLPHIVAMLLHQTVETLYEFVPKEMNLPLYKLFCQCLAELPDDLIDKVTAQDFSELDVYPRSLFVRCYLVSRGKQPLAWINAAVDAYMCKTESDAEECLRFLTHCFHAVHNSDAEVSRATKCHTWVLELMGHIKNIATEVVPVEGLQVPQVLDFLLLVLSAAFSSWSGSPECQLITAPVEIGTDTWITERHLASAGSPTIKPSLRASLPLSLERSMQRDPWRQSGAKIIGWLMMLCRSRPVQDTPHLQSWIQDCLFALKHTMEFKKMAVWSEAFTIC